MGTRETRIKCKRTRQARQRETARRRTTKVGKPGRWKPRSPTPLDNTITPILATTDQTRVVEEEVEAVTQVGGQTEGTLSTHKSR